MAEFGRRKPRRINIFFTLGALGIARESARVILQYSNFLIAITALVICPVSAAVILSRPILGGQNIAKFVVRIQVVASAAGFPETQFTKMIYLKLSETISSYIFCLPFIVTFSLIAKAAVTHTVACIYAGFDPLTHRLLRVLPNIWHRLLFTYTWICIIVLGSNAVVFLFLLLLFNVFGALGLSSNWVFFSALAGEFLYSVIFAHAIIVCNLATVVSVVEDSYGLDAIFRAKFLINGRTRIALLISLMTNLSSAFVEILFQHRVISIYSSSDDVSSVLWEGPLLVFIYSLVDLMDIVMNCVFYYTCKSSRMESFWEHSSESLLSSKDNEGCGFQPAEPMQILVSKE
eukprot:Gb_24690 [translate_table: standard]